MTMKIHIHAIVSQPFAENTYLAWMEDSSTAVVVDPGLEPDLIVNFLRDNALAPAALLCTHGHADHIGGNEALKNEYPDVPLMIGAGDAGMLDDPVANVSALFGLPVTSPPADRLLSEGEQLEFAGLCLDVLDTPGHSPGHIVFVCDSHPKRVFGGDTLFQNGVGRIDLPGGDGPALEKSIREKLFTLPDDTIVYPGHGPQTTIGAEKRPNPFVGGMGL